MSERAPLRLGTRGSPLAIWQADFVAARLRDRGIAVERVLISTSGDRDQSASISQIGGVGAFTKEIQRALIDGRIDLAVHSLKDLPTEEAAGLAIAAVPERGPAGDVLVTVDGRPFADLPLGARIGTGSLRRRAHLWHVRADLRMEDVRGNVDTRLKKLAAGQYDALVLAEAGLARLDLAAGMTWPIPHALLLPAVGQGALAVECRADDPRVLAAVAPLDDIATHAAVDAERSLLAALTAGCLAPVGAYGRVAEDGTLWLTTTVLSADGKRKLVAESSGPLADAKRVGKTAAGDLLGQGAGELIAAARGSSST